MDNDSRKVENIVIHTRLALEFSKLPVNAESEEKYQKIIDRKKEILVETQILRMKMQQLLQVV